jgi:hypothetical protein
MMKVESTIYEPPRPDFPHLVVTLTSTGVSVETAADRTEARTIVSRLTRRKVQKEAKNETSYPDQA